MTTVQYRLQSVLIMFVRRCFFVLHEQLIKIQLTQLGLLSLISIVLLLILVLCLWSYWSVNLTFFEWISPSNTKHEIYRQLRATSNRFTQVERSHSIFEIYAHILAHANTLDFQLIKCSWWKTTRKNTHLHPSHGRIGSDHAYCVLDHRPEILSRTD